MNRWDALKEYVEKYKVKECKVKFKEGDVITYYDPTG